MVRRFIRMHCDHSIVPGGGVDGEPAISVTLSIVRGPPAAIPGGDAAIASFPQRGLQIAFAAGDIGDQG
jgi:hypothetical protein